MPADTGVHDTRTTHAPNLLPESPPEAPRRGTRKTRIYSCFFIILILLITGCATVLARSNNHFFVGVQNGFIIRQLTHIFGSNGYTLQGEKDDRINFLL